MTKTIDYETVQKVRYIANDGTEFEKELDCKVYETELSASVKRAMFDKIFGDPYLDYATEWTRGNGECWYNVRIESKDDFISFLKIMEDFDNPFINETFIDKVNDILDNGEIYTMLIYNDPECNYMNKVGNYPIKSKECYESVLKMIDNLYKLADDFKKYISYEPEEEGENK